jgi:hypothetical protein
MRLPHPSSFGYSPVATYDYGNFPAPGQEALLGPIAVHWLPPGFSGPEERNVLGRRMQKLRTRSS